MNTFTRKVLLYALSVVALPAMLLGQDVTTPAPTTTDPATLGLKVVIIAGVVSSVLQGIKRLFPIIQGNAAKAIAVISAVAAAYAVAPPEGVLSIMFVLQVLGTVFSTLGVHGLAKSG